jgi:hypothetical protein
MLELIFVIIVLGIVSSIGAGIIANVYESYLTQRAVHNASLRTELAINELANRLTYRIDMSMIARLPQGGPVDYTSTGANPTIYPARNVPTAKLNSHSALEWINYDNDNFSTYKIPRWSGFVDLNRTAGNPTNTTAVKTPGSKLNTLTNYYNGVKKRAIVFLGTTSYYDDGAGDIRDYSPLCMYNANGCIFPVTIAGNLKFTLGTGLNDGDRTAGNMIYTEFYQLASSAFAIVPENNRILTDTTVGVYDLVLYYGYQPWLGENYKSGSKSILLKDVSVFRFRKEDNAIRLKICTVERLGDQETISICKEKAVIR